MMKIILYLLVIVLGVRCQTKSPTVSLVKYEGKYGFIDKKGKWFIKPTFDSLGVFYNGFADSYKDGKVGEIDSKGKLIVGHKFDFIGHFENDLAHVLINDSTNYVNLKGQLISPIFFFDGGDFSGGLAAVQFIEDGKWGYLDTSGEIAIDLQFDNAGEFNDGKAEVEIGDFELIINRSGVVIDTVKHNPSLRKYTLIGNSDYGNLGIVNKQGDTIMAMRHKSFGYRQGKLFWFYTGDKYGVADTTGAIIIKPVYEKLTYFSDNGLAAAKKNGKYGFIDNDGSVHLDFKFEDAQGFKYGLAAVKQNGKWGFTDRTGKFIIKPKFENVASQFRPVNSKFDAMYNYERE